MSEYKCSTYFLYDPRVNTQVRWWCIKTLGPCKDKWTFTLKTLDGWEHAACYKFKDEKSKLLFELRWNERLMLFSTDIECLNNAHLAHEKMQRYEHS